MPLPVFTDDDIQGVRRAKIWLARMPRIRMLTAFSRGVTHNLTLAAIILSRPSIRGLGVRTEARRVSANGRDVGVRILRPEGAARGVHLDIHGGGWCSGTAEMNDRPNAHLVRDCGIAVVSVDYRRAPACTVPELIDDCETAARWLFANAEREFGTGRITIGGESAGAHLAACTLVRRPGRFAAALLYYGIYDLSGSEAFRRAPKNTLVFHGPTMLPCLQRLTQDLDDEARRDPRISPVFADLSGLPPVLIIAGGDDPLADESRALHRLWQAANGNSGLLIVPEAPHAFNRLPISLARKTDAYAHDWLSGHFSAVSQ